MLLALVAALLAGAALVACGGGDAETDDLSATEILERTFGERDAGEGFTSGVLTISLDLDLPEDSGTGGPLSLELTGPFQTPGDGELPRFAFELGVTAQGQTLTGGATSTGEQGFVSLQGADYVLPDDLYAQLREGYERAQADGESESDEDRPSLASLGIDPTAWLVDPRKAGAEEVGGVETEHVTAGVDVAKLVEDLQTSAKAAGDVGGRDADDSAEQIGRLKEQIEAAKVDVFTGADDLLLRRFVADLTLAGGGTATLTIEIDELNEDQDVEAPSDARPIDELVSQFQGLLGAGGAPSSSGGEAGGSAKQQRYLACVQAAGQDLEKVQDCAKHL